MKKGDILIICLILCFICSLQAIAASDLDNTCIGTTDDNVVSIENVSAYSLPGTDDAIGDSVNAKNFTYLKDNLNSADFANYNYTWEDGDPTDGIVLSGQLTLDGDGKVIIDAKNNARIFKIAQGANVTLKGITFINGNATVNGETPGHGGSVLANGEVHIDDCNFINNTATYGNGGAVFLKVKMSTITNSYFENNRAINNGKNGIGAGGAVFLINATHNATISHSTFKDNYAGLNGGAIATQDGITNCTIINCTFESNTANGSAGAVGMQSSNFHMYNSTFKYNEARGLFTGDVYYPGNGGGIVLRASDSYVYNSTFIGNIANLYGGASYLTNTSDGNINSNTGFELCTFTNNTARTGSGGAINWVANATQGYIRNSSFTNNTAMLNGGAVYWMGSEGTISNSTFSNNTANRSGGAVYWKGTDGNILHSNFTENKAYGLNLAEDSYGTDTYGGNGGAIMWVGSDGYVYDCTFTNNSAYGHDDGGVIKGGKGGAVYLQGSSAGICNNTEFDKCVFIDNYAQVNGGAIDWYSGARNGIVNNSVFTNNIANRSGGAIFWSGIGGVISNSNFTNNSAKGNTAAIDSYGIVNTGGHGGAIMWVGPNGTVYNCSFEYNTAEKHGGGVYLQGGLVAGNCTNTTFDKCTFINNTAGLNGGAINWQTGAHNGSVNNTKFINNTALNDGGALYIEGIDSKIENSTFESNNATLNGGAINIIGNFTKIIKCSFNDTHSRYGGCIYVVGHDAEIINSNFTNSMVLEDGAGLYVRGENCSVYNSTFADNIAGDDGGAMSWRGANGYIYNVTCIRNFGISLSYYNEVGELQTSSSNGGSISLEGNNVTIAKSSFDTTSALIAGGAIYVTGNLANITGCSFYQCNVSHTANNIKPDYANGGGAIYVLGNDSYVTDCTFDKCNGREGGIIYIQGHDVTIDNATTNRSFALNGGGIYVRGANVTIKNSEIKLANATASGGSLYIEGDNSTVCNVTVDVSVAKVSGGAMYVSGNNMTLVDSIFHNCTVNMTNSVGAGGALYILGNYSDIDNCTFNATRSRYGGCIYVVGHDAEIKNSNFSNSMVFEDGAGLYVRGENCSVYNSTFEDNVAGDDGGAMSWRGANGYIYNVTCVHNVGISLNYYDENGELQTSTSNGGSISLEGNNATIAKSSFDTTSALIAGGAIFVTSNNATITDCSFYQCNVSHNAAGIKDEYANGGGAIYVLGNYSNVINCTFDKCNGREGGIIYIQGHDVTIDNATTNRSFALNGGAIYVQGANATIKDSEIKLANATSCGGGIYVDGIKTNITGSTFMNNTANVDGGSIFVNGVNATIMNSTFRFNNATNHGGSIYVEGDRAEILGATISNAHATTGGAIYVDGNNTYIGDTSVSRSFADNYGGAVYVGGNNATISNSSFTQNNCTLHGGAIYVNGDLTEILDSNFTMDIAAGYGGAIYIQGVNTTVSGIISNITQANGTGTHGGSIYVNGQNTTINSSAFYMAHANGSGGAIYIHGDYSKVTDSNFTRTSADIDGGAIYIDAVNTTVSGSRFFQSNATRSGGAIYILGQYAYVFNSTFANVYSFATTANTGGGAIYIKGNNATVELSNFTNASAKFKAGAIYIDGRYANIIDSFFNRTSASQSESDYATTNLGGAIYIIGHYANVSGSEFHNSEAYQGGVIYLEGNYCNVTNSSFNNSYASWDGGAIYSTGSNSNVVGSNFTNNVAGYDGGAIFWHGGTNSLNNLVDGCIFINNTAYAPDGSLGSRTTRGGGAIYWSEGGKYGAVINSQFINNSVQSNNKADGGAILWDKGSHGVIDNCTFDGNYITTSHAVDVNIWVQGGAVFLRANCNFTISNSEFRNCWSDKEGGALYISNQQATVLSPLDILVSNVTFINNTAKGNLDAKNNRGGGAMLVKECNNVILDNITAINNTANYGGAITFDSLRSNIQLVNSTLDANNATMYGGAIWANSNFALGNITMSNNNAKDTGGGIYLTAGVTKFVYANLTFISNNATYAGAFNWEREHITISDMVFINNTATYGGALYINKNNNTVLDNNFTGNSAIYGGAVYASYNNLHVLNNNFTNNSAVYGGAIYAPVNNNVPDITYSDFTGNHADYGGAIYAGFKGSDTKRIAYSNFTNNSAIDGGAIFVANNNNRIVNCTFEGNNATGNGGATYVNTTLTEVYITDSTFIKSHAGNGGALYYNTASSTYGLKINNDTFINNTATYNGGAVLYLTKGGAVAYRDYNNFDGIGQVSSDTNRTNVSAVDTSTKFIITSLFENNTDYEFIIVPYAYEQSPTIMISLLKPTEISKNSLRFVVNVTNETGMVKQVIVTEENFEPHYNELQGILYVNVDELRREGVYNISVEFYNAQYMHKEYNTTETAHGSDKGEFAILQDAIEANITQQQGSDIYIIYLDRAYSFTYDDFNRIYDDGCMNITNIDKPLIIYGNGWTIDAKGYSRIFNITSSNVTFVNIEFANGNAGGLKNDSVNAGGAIYWAGANGSLNNSFVYNNTAELGGGIYYNVSASNSKIVNSTFTLNNANTRGGAIDCNSSMSLENTTFDSNHAYIGAALCREVNATGGHGYNNTFINNHADYAGAALAWMNSSSIHIDTYYFYNNYVGYSGGAIYIGEGSGNCLIENSVFENNYVENETGGHGGAIEWYAEKGTVSNSNFTNNRAYDGGAIFVGSDSGKINITDSNFYNNNATVTGGAVSLNASSVTINASNFYDNHAGSGDHSGEGGALYVGGIGDTNYVYDSVFERNTVSDGNGGAISWIASSGTVVSSNFTGNCANYGGGLYFGGLSDSSEVSQCIFTDNHAKYRGGAIDSNATQMTLINTIFDANYAQFGAALCREVNAERGSGENNTFINNHAYVSGAALAWMGSIGITITNYTFTNNTANVSGGAIHVSPNSHNCSIINSTFENNYVTNATIAWEGSFTWDAWDGMPMTYRVDYTDDIELINKTVMNTQETVYYYALGSYPEDLGVGGAINCLASNATIENSNFTGNYARLGGALYVGSDSGNTNIDNAIFTSNRAYEQGGAINLHASAVHVDDSKFYNNEAKDGAALYVGGIGTHNLVHESVFESNTATGYGAGIYWIAQAGEIRGSNFTNNSARYGGGIFFNGRSANTNVTDSIFMFNNATKNGGAIECNASNIGIYNLTFDSNYAGEYGAALCREAGATGGHGTNNTFIANHADISGAGLAWMGVKNIHIVDYKFINNTAYQTGAAIYVAQDSDNAIIDYCVFDGNRILNSTGGHGGAIDVVGDNATIINSNFTDNSAYYGGAVWFDEGSGFVNVTNVTFTRNTATLEGGAINLRGSGITLSDDRFYENTAGENGGALYAGLTGKSSVIYDSVFKNNAAKDHGGAIDWRSQAGEVKNSNFTANSAGYGGAIYLNGISSGSEISNSIFENNTATANGGAIDCNATLMNLTYTKFISNRADGYGAALCRESNATGGFGEYNNFTSNYAGISGAALAWMGVSNININHYIFIDNTAGVSGGAIYVGENSNNCTVNNSEFGGNNVSTGRGGAIDWIGSDGQILNTTFKNSLALNGGAIYLASTSNNTKVINTSFTSCYSLGAGGAILWYGNNGIIISTNFTSSLAFDHGGAVAGFNADNMTIIDSSFKYGLASGYKDGSGGDYGEGGAIYWQNATNLKLYNLTFFSNDAHADGGSIAAVNCNDSILYNLTFGSDAAVRNGGSISWIDSDNLTMDLLEFIYVGSVFDGGSIYLNNTNANITNSIFNDTKAAWGNGGAIYANGNVAISNSTFLTFDCENDGEAIYFKAGNSTLYNSTLIGHNAIFIDKYATIYLTRNNITGENPTKSIYYIEDNTDVGASKVDYSVWNDGILYLDKNTFDYVIFNNGTIKTPTTTYMLGNDTYNCTVNDTFVFWAHIVDDFDNTVISVASLNSGNQLTSDEYFMPYNKLLIPHTYYQGAFQLRAFDNSLEENTVYNGTLYVKMPTITELGITSLDYTNQTVTIQATISPAGNFTITGKVKFTVNGEDNFTDVLFINGKYVANLTITGLPSKGYTITANYTGDDTHWDSLNSTLLQVGLRTPWIQIVVDNISYGQNATAVVTTNGTGRVVVYVHGRSFMVPIVDGRGEVNITDLKPGNYSAVVIYTAYNNQYFSANGNETTFVVYNVGTSIEANATTPIHVGDTEVINVTLNETATGFVKITINGKVYIEEIKTDGKVQFNITGLANGTYENIPVEYMGDDVFRGNSTTVTFTVNPKEDYKIDLIINEVYYPDNATIRVILPTDATGNVTIYIDDYIVKNVTIVSGEAILANVSGLAGGQHSINVTYEGCSVYAYKEINQTFTVNANTGWDIGIDAVYGPYGENSVIYIRTAPYNLTNRYVTVIIDDIPYNVNLDEFGNGTLTLNNLSAGSHSGRVNYTGDANYSSLSKVFRPSIPKATPTITITHENDNVIATVGGNATGNVTFYINGVEHADIPINDEHKSIGNGLNLGYNYITAVYSGDDNYTTKTSVETIYIELTTTSLTVNATPYAVAVGNNVTINVTMVNVTSGIVLIEVGGYNYTANINDGVARLNITLPLGDYDVKAYYLGDLEHAPCNASGNGFEVVKTDAVISSITVPTGSVASGFNATIKVVMGNVESGKAIIEVNNYNYTVDIVNYEAELNVTLPVGRYNATAYYLEDDKYNSASLTNTTEIVVVGKASPVILITVAGNIHYVGEYVTITATSYDGADIAISVNGVRLTGNRYYVPSVGTYTVTAYTEDTENYGPGWNVTAFNAVKKVPTITVSVESGVHYADSDVTISVSTDSTAGYVTKVNNEIVSGGKYHVKSEGDYTVVVTTNEDGRFYAGTGTTTFTVVKSGAVIDHVDIPASEVASVVSVNVTMGNVESGKLLIEVNNHNFTVDIVDYVARLNVALPAGEYPINVYYLGDATYGSTSAAAGSVKVVGNPETVITLDISDGPYYVGDNVTITASASSGAGVTVLVDGKALTGNVYTLDHEGSYSIVAFSGEASTYIDGWTSTTLYANKLASNVVISIEDDNIVATVTSGATGNVSFYVDGAEFTREIIDNRAVLEDKYSYVVSSVVAHYAGDYKYNCSDDSIAGPDKETPIVTISLNSPVIVGNQVIINVTGPSDIEGNATLMVGGKEYLVHISEGKGSIAIASLGEGTYEIIVVYLANDKYAYATNSTTLVVNKTASSIDVKFDNITVGENAVFNITLPDDASGTITIRVGDYENTVRVVGGLNNVIVPNMGVGEYIVNVTYNGDDKYNPITSENALFKVSSSSSIAFSVNDLNNGTVIVTLADASAEGSVEIIVDNQTFVGDVVDGVAVVNLDGITPGKYDVVVAYIDEYDSRVEMNTSISIMKYESPIEASVINITVGSSEIIIVNLPVNATGRVTVEIDGIAQTKEVSGGSVTFEIAGLMEGSKTAIITYAGDSNYAENYTTAKFTVSKVNPLMTVNSSTIDEFVIITAKLPSDATGQVLFDIGGVGYYANVTNGVATISVPNVSGADKATVTYTGDYKYNSSSAKVDIDVDKIDSFIYVNARDIQSGETENIILTVPVDATGSVRVIVDGKIYTAEISNGVAYISISGLSKDTYAVEAIYDGDAKYKSSTNDSVSFRVGISIITDIITRGYNSTYDYNATFLDEDDNPLANTSVQFIVGGKTYNVTTNAQGIAYLPGGILEAGNHTVISVNPVTDYETYGTAVIVPRLKENKNLAMDFWDGSAYSVRVYGDDGKSVGAGEVVTMVITGSWGTVTYKVTTDANGYANRTIGLSPGTYTVHAEYKGYKVVNTITVKSTLSAKSITVKKSAKTTTFSATLKWSNGKAIVGKTIKFRFSGKTYYAKTNSKGVASIKITKSMVKNLKVGKSYNIKVTYETTGSYKASEYVNAKIKIAS